MRCAVNIRFRIIDALDRRTVEQMRAHDEIERKRFALRVGRNAKERARLERESRCAAGRAG